MNVFSWFCVTLSRLFCCAVVQFYFVCICAVYQLARTGLVLCCAPLNAMYLLETCVHWLCTRLPLLSACVHFNTTPRMGNTEHCLSDKHHPEGGTNKATHIKGLCFAVRIVGVPCKQVLFGL